MLIGVLLLLLLGIIHVCVSPATDTSVTPRVVCYYANWSIYRTPLARFSPLNIPPHLCTNIHYAFGTVDEEGRLGPSDGNSDFSHQGYEQLARLKQHNPQLVNLLSMGGSDILQKRFEAIASNRSLTGFFVDNCIKYLMEHKFDGLELDWQMPSTAEKHISLVEALAGEFRSSSRRNMPNRLILSVTLPVDMRLLQTKFSVRRVANVADYVVSLQYRYHAATSNVTGHHAPLRAIGSDHSELNMASSSLIYRAMGVPANKLVLGVPAFGITATLEDPEMNEYGAPSLGPGEPGKLTKSPGSLAFYEICENLASEGWKAVKNYPRATGPYAFKKDQWVAYDDEAMMKIKGEFVRYRGLGGVAVWSLSQDDFRGFCTGVKFPLIMSIKKALYGMNSFEDFSTPAPPTTPTYDNRKLFVCPSDGNFPKIDDCSKFYFCKDKTAEELDCPAGEMFNSIEGKCSSGASCINQEIETVSQFPPTPLPSSNVRTFIERPVTEIPSRVIQGTDSDAIKDQISSSSNSDLQENTNRLELLETFSGSVHPVKVSTPTKSLHDLVQLISLMQQFTDINTNNIENQDNVVEKPSIESKSAPIPISERGIKKYTPLRVRVTVDITPESH